MINLFFLILIRFPFRVRKTKSHSQSRSPPDRQFNQRGVAESKENKDKRQLAIVALVKSL